MVSCVVLYFGRQCYPPRLCLIFMPIPVVQIELIWGESRIKLSRVGPSPWVSPLGRGPHWAAYGGPHTSPRRCRAGMLAATLPPFRSVKTSFSMYFHGRVGSICTGVFRALLRDISGNFSSPGSQRSHKAQEGSRAGTTVDTHPPGPPCGVVDIGSRRAQEKIKRKRTFLGSIFATGSSDRTDLG